MKKIKKGTILKIKNIQQLEKEPGIKKCLELKSFKKGEVNLRDEMIKLKTITVQQDSYISDTKPIYLNGWFWYPWMFNTDNTNQLDLE